MNYMDEIQKLFPSQDGNKETRDLLVSKMNQLITEFDKLKNPAKLTLGEMPEYTEDYYNQIISTSNVPEQGITLDETIEEILKLAKGHRYPNSNYLANATPLPNIASILGNLLMVLLNGNNVWDVEGAAAANAEVRITSMLSKIVGYDPNQSAGYTTWGGQGAVFNSLRLAIARQFPEANRTGIPNNLYCFCSELSHYSLYKSVEATGIGTDHLIRIKANRDHSMNLQDLQQKMEEVIQNGGIPVYVLATMGTTDTFGIDHIREIKNITTSLEEKYNLPPIYIHADTAMGGMYTFFNDYDFETNPLQLEEDVCQVLKGYQSLFKDVHLADSMVFDFHKLGQTPYITSLFLIKDKMNLQYVDLDPTETPYVGNRGYGSYHTSYTLECSRMGSAIPIYASLLAFGIKGYQQLLANYIRVNLEFRKKLMQAFPNVAVTNNVSPVTTFRFYPEKVTWEEEVNGKATYEEIEAVNKYNDNFAELIGLHRDMIYFGSTKKQRLVEARNTNTRVPIYAHKFYTVSPYTTVQDVERYIDFLKHFMDIHSKELVLI
ncbi:glutamate/tyrosine decarboxylase-like PLP-dependent enzyme [Anoxybacillus calidus]|jgi:L-2,4-diaminobutyrate decarboxylase|uniref:Glutamate/tyrosine decarboxylase-like PLP-dependent enzyme n=2 Tax=[Anoxybacillus] calidus TaxID=575178 RepID=A0A7V9Z008_9BACL|nr:glutamate/tyrosine decarboxylase-like PLP-dependent enzyme [Anoxybacillus calidus]